MYKIWRSSASVFGDETCPDGINGIEKDETLSAVDIYTDEELQKIADAGFNAIWVHGLLRHLVKVEPFPELGQYVDMQLAAVRQLSKRAAQYGIKVFIYMQPPRALPQSDTDFWDNHLDIWGEEDICRGLPVRRFCTSAPKVKQWLKNAGTALAQSLPGLAGIILITGSEFPQHCYSHRVQKCSKPWHRLIECPRCKEREPEDVVTELITLIRDGVREVSPDMDIITWDWSWRWNGDSEEKMVSQLPSDIIMMADFERGGHKDLYERPGFFMDEYSLSYAGPSEQCRIAFDIALKHGRRFMSKLQLGTTHELASVVTLPMPGSLYDKALFHHKNKIDGYMGCWNFGNALPNSNVEAFNFFLSDKCPDDKKQALQAFAKLAFPDADPGLLMEAWQAFEDAMFYYPFTIAFLYHGPQNHTLSHKSMYHPASLKGIPSGRSWKDDERGDDLSNSYSYHHTQFNLDEIIDRVVKLAEAWGNGVEIFRRAFANCSDKKSLDELGNAIICSAVWHSTANSFRVFKLRKSWDDSKREEFFKFLDDELDELKNVLPWVERDPRQGFHIEPDIYMFDAKSIREKINALEKIKEEEYHELHVG
jgi:hypothetical protein